jgi:hypothetical protein
MKHYKNSIFISLFSIATLLLTACSPERKEVHTVQQKITPNSAEQVNMNYIIAGLKNKGFNCTNFDNGIKKPMVFCSRIKGKDVDACSDSIWIEHDGQNHVMTNQQFYECDGDRKMVITRKP